MMPASRVGSLAQCSFDHHFRLPGNAQDRRRCPGFGAIAQRFKNHFQPADLYPGIVEVTGQDIV
jgi:hypothetical protein